MGCPISEFILTMVIRGVGALRTRNQKQEILSTSKYFVCYSFQVYLRYLNKWVTKYLGIRQLFYQTIIARLLSIRLYRLLSSFSQEHILSWAQPIRMSTQTCRFHEQTVKPIVTESILWSNRETTHRPRHKTGNMIA